MTPNVLAPASFDPQLIKEEILQYYKGLIASIKNNYVLVEQSFHSVLLGDKDLMIHILQPGDLIYWKRHFHKSSLQPHRKGPCAPNSKE